jgi:hypothetical protein
MIDQVGQFSARSESWAVPGPSGLSGRFWAARGEPTQADRPGVGQLGVLAAICRASSRVRRCAAERRPGSSSKMGQSAGELVDS